MVHVAQINIIVADLERSRIFYELFGAGVSRPESTRRGPGRSLGVDERRHHSGAALDLVRFVVGRDRAAAVPRRTAGGSRTRVGAATVKPPTDMPWGQRFAIVCDPDGHRVGLKAPLGA